MYIKDIVERKKIEREDVLSQILDLLCSSVGSLTNPTKITNTLRSQKIDISLNTVKTYFDYLIDAFLFQESKRYDIKGKKYFEYPNKYYIEDVGLRNARLGYRQVELSHIMENIIYNELIIRGYNVDVGIIINNEKNSNGIVNKVYREIDIVANKGNKKIYVQSAFALESIEKTESEIKPFLLTKDSFLKIIVRKDIVKRWYDEKGILNINVIDFLLDKDLF